jgi:Rieske Fe-S protein
MVRRESRKKFCQLMVFGGAVCVLSASLSMPQAWAQEGSEKKDDSSVIEMEPIQVEGKRIENIESVKKELAKRPGSSILIEEKEIVQSRALNLSKMCCNSLPASDFRAGTERMRDNSKSVVRRCVTIFIIAGSIS